MEQQTTLAAPPPPTTPPTPTTTPHQPGPTTTRPEPTPLNTKLRLMCSYGGHIVTRPYDKSLCYVGGDTRMLIVDRHTTLSNLTTRLTKTFNRSSTSPPTTSFLIKYKLPSEDLDSLISLTTDEDLEIMIDEFEKLNNTSSFRIRLFLFPGMDTGITGPVSSIGSFLESSVKSEDWFLNALNGINGVNGTASFSDTMSVNRLLGLEDDVAVKSSVQEVDDKSGVCKGTVQDVQSVPESQMPETASSFGSGSASSTLSPVAVRVDELQKVGGGIEVQFLQTSVQNHEEVGFVAKPVPVAVTENNKASADSVSCDGSLMSPLSSKKPPVVFQEPATRAPDGSNILDQDTRVQVQHQLPQQPQQPQFIHTAVPPPQYFQHHQSGAVQMPPFYRIYPSHPQQHAPRPALDQQNVVYCMPIRQPSHGYTLPLQADGSPAVSGPPSNQVPPPSGLFAAPRAVPSAIKTEQPPAGVYRTTTMNSGASAPQLVQIPSSQQQILPQFAGYSHVHQPTQPILSGGGGRGNYIYEFTDPAQQGQRIYYPAQPLPPQSAAQYPAMTSTLPVEAQAVSHLQAGNSMNQQVKTSQP